MTYIDTDDEDTVLVVSVTKCGCGEHFRGELHVQDDVPPEAVLKLLTDIADKHLRDSAGPMAGLVVVSPREFREKIEEATRAKGAYSNVLPFGAPARGPARGWG